MIAPPYHVYHVPPYKTYIDYPRDAHARAYVLKEGSWYTRYGGALGSPQRIRNTGALDPEITAIFQIGIGCSCRGEWE